MNELKKIYSFHDEKYEPLAEIFKKTIKDDYEICISKITSIVGQDIWIEKTQSIINAISENTNDYVIFADIDIQFFRETRPLIEPLFGNDVLVQWQVGDIGNIGFMVILCNDSTKLFFSEVLEKCKLGVWDQKVINDKLKSDELKWSFLPKKFYAFHADNPKPPKDTVLHHATWEYNPKEKIKQMKTIRKYLNNVCL